MSSARRAVPTAGAWAALLNAPAVAARELARAELPDAAGVYLWKRDGEPVYVGMATSLRGRAWGKHLGGGVSLAGSSLRRNVCELLFGIPPNVTGRPTRQKVTTEQAAAVRNWLLGCELSWLEVPWPIWRRPPVPCTWWRRSRIYAAGRWPILGVASGAVGSRNLAAGSLCASSW